MNIVKKVYVLPWITNEAGKISLFLQISNQYTEYVLEQTRYCQWEKDCQGDDANWKIHSLGNGLVMSYSHSRGVLRIHDTLEQNRVNAKTITVAKESCVVAIPDGSISFVNGSSVCRLDFEEKCLLLEERPAQKYRDL